MKKYTFITTVEANSADEANQVIAERLGHDEDYGFDYRVDWEDHNPGATETRIALEAQDREREQY